MPRCSLVIMLRKYEIDHNGHPTISIIPDRVVKLMPHLPLKEEINMIGGMGRSQFTHWLTFDTLTHEISYIQMNGRNLTADVYAGKYDDSLIFILVGTTYRLISKAGSELQRESGVFTIDVGGLVHDEEIVRALKEFIKENATFVWRYNSQRRSD